MGGSRMIVVIEERDVPIIHDESAASSVSANRALRYVPCGCLGGTLSPPSSFGRFQKKINNDEVLG